MLTYTVEVIRPDKSRFFLAFDTLASAAQSATSFRQGKRPDTCYLGTVNIHAFYSNHDALAYELNQDGWAKDKMGCTVLGF